MNFVFFRGSRRLPLIRKITSTIDHLKLFDEPATFFICLSLTFMLFQQHFICMNFFINCNRPSTTSPINLNLNLCDPFCINTSLASMRHPIQEHTTRIGHVIQDHTARIEHLILDHTTRIRNYIA